MCGGFLVLSGFFRWQACNVGILAGRYSYCEWLTFQARDRWRSRGLGLTHVLGCTVTDLEACSTGVRHHVLMLLVSGAGHRELGPAASLHTNFSLTLLHSYPLPILPSSVIPLFPPIPPPALPPHYPWAFPFGR